MKPNKLHISQSKTLNSYASRLHEVFPNYTIKEIEFFLKSSFKFYKIIIRDSHSLDSDAEIILGNFLKLKFNRNKYKWGLFLFFQKLLKKHEREGTTAEIKIL